MINLVKMTIFKKVSYHQVDFLHYNFKFRVRLRRRVSLKSKGIFFSGKLFQTPE